MRQPGTKPSATVRMVTRLFRTIQLLSAALFVASVWQLVALRVSYQGWHLRRIHPPFTWNPTASAWLSIATFLAIYLASIDMRSFRYRYLALAGARAGGPIVRWLRTEWRPFPVLVLLTLSIVLLPRTYLHPLHMWAVDIGLTRTPEEKVTPALRASIILSLDLIISLFWLVVTMRRRVVVEGFRDLTGPAPAVRDTAPKPSGSADSPEGKSASAQAPAGSISVMLCDALARMERLYHTVNNQTAVMSKEVQIPVRDANIRTEAVTSLVKDAVPTDSKLRLGLFEIPLRPFVQLVSWLAQGPRITGALYREGNLLILNAQMYGGARTLSWSVDNRDPRNRPISSALGAPYVAEPLTQPRTLQELIEELACRIFTDIALESAVRWTATWNFNEGLRKYRDCLSTHKDRKIKLRQAEKAFMRALAEDDHFEWAYYNLGLVYTGLGLSDSAIVAFHKAIEQKRDQWENYYALAQVYLEHSAQKNHAFVIALCERVIMLKPMTAKGYRMLCEAYLRQVDTLSFEGRVDGDQFEANLVAAKEYLERALACGESAVSNSWLILCAENWSNRSSNPAESRLNQRVQLAQQCVGTLARVHIRFGDILVRSGQSGLRHFRQAQRLYRQSIYLCSSDADSYLGMGRAALKTAFDSQLKVIYRAGDVRGAHQSIRLADLNRAADELRLALRIDSARADVWCRVWLTSLLLQRRKEARTKAQDGSRSSAAPHVAVSGLHMGLLSNEQIHLLARKEFYDRSCGAMVHELATIRADYRVFPNLDAEIEEVETIRRRNDVYFAVQRAMRSDNQAALTLARLYEEYGESTGGGRDVWVDGQVAIALLRLDAVNRATVSQKSDADSNSAGDRTLASRIRQWKSLLALRGQTTSEPQWLFALVEEIRARIDRLEAQVKLERTALALPTEPDAEEVASTNYWSPTRWHIAQLRLMLGRLIREARVRIGVDTGHNAVECFHIAIEMLESDGLHTQIQQQALHASLAEAHLETSRSRYASRRPSIEALTHAETAVETDPLGAYERAVLGKVYTDFSELQEAGSASEDAQLCSPDAPIYLLAEGDAYLRLARECRTANGRIRLLERAVPFLEEALMLFSSSQITEKGRTHFTLGHVFRELNSHERSVGHFHVAEALNFAPLTSLYSKSWAILHSGQYEEAAASFDHTLQTAREQYAILDVLLTDHGPNGAGGAPMHQWPSIHDPEECLCSIIDASLEIDKERSLAWLAVNSLAGKIQSYLIRCSVPPDYAVSIRCCERIVDAMQLCHGLRPTDLRVCRGTIADCKGWRLMADATINGYPETIDAAIGFFQEAIVQSYGPDFYYHLALAYARRAEMMPADSHQGERLRLVSQAQESCVQLCRLDLRNEFVERAKQLGDRLTAISTRGHGGGSGA